MVIVVKSKTGLNRAEIRESGGEKCIAVRSVQTPYQGVIRCEKIWIKKGVLSEPKTHIFSLLFYQLY